MCGRFSQTKSKDAIKKRFNAQKVAEGVLELYNIAPEQPVPVILNEAPEEIQLARWGLVPSWSKEINSKYSMINARAETLLEKPSYKRLLFRRRCLVIADSFYEWQKASIKKIPYRIMLKSEEPFAFAGLWDLWEGAGEGALISCTIITTSPNKLTEPIHDRMPVILPRQDESRWLNETDSSTLLGMLKSYDPADMQAYTISTAVNNPSNQSKEIIAPVN